MRSVIRATSQALPDTFDRRQIAEAAGLPTALGDLPEEACDIDAFRRLWRAIMNQTDDPSLPFEVGTRLPYGTYEVIDYLTGASASVGAALEQLARYFGLITPWFGWDCRGREEPPKVMLVSNQQGPEENLIFIQYILGVTFARVRDLSSSPVEYLEVNLAIPRPSTGERYERFFGCPVRYDTPHSMVAMTRPSWETPLERSEPGLRDILQQHADTLMAAVRHDDGLASIRTEIQRQLPNGAPKLGAVAKALAMSARTLQRRLQEAGTSFQALVDEERASAARAYLSDARLGLDEIAFLLGYSEASAFSRAFKRWTGRTPRGYRAVAAT